VFVLPAIRACERDMSPLQLGLTNAWFAFTAWPVFPIALGLAWLTLLQPPERPRPEAERAALAAPIATWIGSILSARAIVEDLSTSTHAAERIVPALALLVALPLSIVAFVRALRAAGWTRWRRAIASFAAAAWLTYPAQMVVPFLFNRTDRADLRWGAYVFAAAMVWLSVAAARRD
jgi:hypothetical protein